MPSWVAEAGWVRGGKDGESGEGVGRKRRGDRGAGKGREEGERVERGEREGVRGGGWVGGRVRVGGERRDGEGKGRRGAHKNIF